MPIDKGRSFVNNELKGELDPAIFYKNQQNTNGVTAPSGSKREVSKLKLEFDSSDKDSDRREFEHQEQIKKLNF